MKDTYLPHDLGARNDPKMVALKRSMGGQGKAIFWDLVEMLWENDGYYPTDYEMIAYDLRYCDAEEVRRVVEDFGLFEHADGRFWSESALRRIQRKKQTSDARAQAGRASGEARREQALNTPRTNVEQMFNTPRTINQLSNSLNKESISECAGASAPAREEDDDFFVGKFFFRNFQAPAYETRRCLEHYSGTEIKNRESVAKNWTPENTSPRFNDPRIMSWARKLWAIVGTSAGPHAAAECLRHINDISLDKGRNELTVRMDGNDWGLSIRSTLELNPPLQEGFKNVKVVKVTGT